MRNRQLDNLCLGCSNSAPVFGTCPDSSSSSEFDATGIKCITCPEKGPCVKSCFTLFFGKKESYLRKFYKFHTMLTVRNLKKIIVVCSWFYLEKLFMLLKKHFHGIKKSTPVRENVWTF
jgi:hypothetical protein